MLTDYLPKYKYVPPVFCDLIRKYYNSRLNDESLLVLNKLEKLLDEIGYGYFNVLKKIINEIIQNDETRKKDKICLIKNGKTIQLQK